MADERERPTQEIVQMLPHINIRNLRFAWRLLKGLSQ